MSCELFVRFREVGFHCWPGAPEHRDYLRDRHRHVFHVEVRLPVRADDSREIEYHDALDVAIERWPGEELGSSSCELLAQTLADELAEWAERDCTVSVSEDGENGATASATQEQGSQRRSAPLVGLPSPGSVSALRA